MNQIFPISSMTQFDSSECLPSTNDGCSKCDGPPSSKRRYSTHEPSVRLCNGNCNKIVYEIHYSCLDCAKISGKCPWCGKDGWNQK